jgi:hypothetical protein
VKLSSLKWGGCLLFVGGGDLGEWRTSPSFLGRNLPSHDTVACRGRCLRRWSRKPGKNHAGTTWTGPKPCELVLNPLFWVFNQLNRVHTGWTGQPTSRQPARGRHASVQRPPTSRDARLGMDSDRIRTDTNSDVTIYHILFRIRIRIRIRILSNTNTKRIFWIRIHIRILTRFTT